MNIKLFMTFKIHKHQLKTQLTKRNKKNKNIWLVMFV